VGDAQFFRESEGTTGLFFLRLDDGEPAGWIAGRGARGLRAGFADHARGIGLSTTHVESGSPPTLLLQGEHDSLVPAYVSRALHRKLVEAGVQSVYVEFPQTEHGFDLLLPRYAPAAQAALYDVDRFLALMV
jgi:acetyl esterase/lipase